MSTEVRTISRIPVYDMVVVSRPDAHTHLDCNAHSLLVRQPGLTLNIFFQRYALHQLHDNVINVVLRAHIIHVDDIGVHETGTAMKKAISTLWVSLCLKC